MFDLGALAFHVFGALVSVLGPKHLAYIIRVLYLSIWIDNKLVCMDPS